MTERDFHRLVRYTQRVRVVIVLSEDEHRELALIALRARKRTNDFARELLVAALAEHEASKKS